MRLVFVHGINQQGKDPDMLRQAWDDALRGAWGKMGLTPPAYDLAMPFYGKLLDDMIHGVTAPGVAGGGANVIARGGAASSMSQIEDALIKDYAAQLGITDADVRTALGQEIVARGPANWEWVQGIARALVNHFPFMGNLALDFIVQVDAYLTRDAMRKAVNDTVRPAFEQGPTVIVAHSLGSVVSYALLDAAGAGVSVPLFVTLGSPLGIPTVRDGLGTKNLHMPAGVEHWVNGTDERDYVALYASLAVKPTPPAIDNITNLHNRADDAHQILDYLAQPPVAQAIFDALSR